VGVAIASAVGRSSRPGHVGKIILLNVLEPTCPSLATIEQHYLSNLLHNTVEVAPKGSDSWVVGIARGLADLQGLLEVGASAGQVALPPQH
jgi:hypothetical protein